MGLGRLAAATEASSSGEEMSGEAAGGARRGATERGRLAGLRLTLEGMTDDDLAFALQVAGTELATEPPAPDSPLGRLRLFAAAHPEVALNADHVRQALEGTL